MNWIGTLPTTNLRIFITIVLAIGYVATALIADVVGDPLSDGTLYGVGAFLTVWAGLDVTQFAVKRNTHIPAPPVGAPDVEDAPTGKKPPIVSALEERYGLASGEAGT